MSEWPGIPRKVLRLAQESGVHNDCLAAGLEGSCGACKGIVEDSLASFYSHLPSSKDVLYAVIDDLLAERFVLK